MQAEPSGWRVVIPDGEVGKLSESDPVDFDFLDWVLGVAKDTIVFDPVGLIVFGAIKPLATSADFGSFSRVLENPTSTFAEVRR